MGRSLKPSIERRTAKEIIQRIQDMYDHKNDAETAAFLGLARNTLSSWRKRNTVDMHLIVTLCDRLDLNWVFGGEEAAPDLSSAMVRETLPTYQVKRLQQAEKNNKELKAKKEKLTKQLKKMTRKSKK